ncbi:DNA-dependent RNA polymerase subunit RPO19 [Cotia virus SPAn232]|uniref:DNA-directed RNA polymerase 19 kDa subunit n=2 Tax=Cotia virus TaxID=39444 RepID=H6TA84_9POXV|nr:DNA-dependent RNA polymerase subunit RPO19 [Cotia virus SPAn232]ADT91124.1 DNA-dependent RNA polymerase subunit RPO19 [Cotia virus SPAn232]AIT70728.1 DNA-dependent RNA polymerase subunit RPO19 [Cotia virus]
MEDIDDIIDDSGSISDNSNISDIDEYEEENYDENKIDNTSDLTSLKQSNKIESITNIEDNVELTICQNISLIKKRYTRRISLFEITGIIAESYNLLQRGRMPLVSDLSDETLKQNILHVLIKEIEEGVCPIVIEKNGELLSIKDFDNIGLSKHINYIINIWKKQNRY